jgi:hypothetical protein
VPHYIISEFIAAGTLITQSRVGLHIHHTPLISTIAIVFTFRRYSRYMAGIFHTEAGTVLISIPLNNLYFRLLKLAFIIVDDRNSYLPGFSLTSL